MFILGNGTSSFKHFLVSHLINLVWVFLVWYIFFYIIIPEGIKNVMYNSFYFLLLYVFLAFMMFFVCWAPA